MTSREGVELPRALALTPVQLRLVEDYVESLRTVGVHTDTKAVWPARAFAARVGSPEDWAALSLREQCALHLRVRHFVTWLLVTQRVAASADYVVVGRPFLGDVALRHHPVFANGFLDTAVSLGFKRGTAMAQWSDLAKLAALHRVRPDRLTRVQFDEGCAALIDAARRHRPNSELRLALAKTFHGAEATLSHLGVFDTPPVKLGQTLARVYAARRSEEWAEVAPTLATTLKAYLDQIALTLRPATVRRTDATLREFSCFLARRAPEVTRVAPGWLICGAPTSRSTSCTSRIGPHSDRSGMDPRGSAGGQWLLTFELYKLPSLASANGVATTSPPASSSSQATFPSSTDHCPASSTTRPRPSCSGPHATRPTPSPGCAWSSLPAPVCAGASSSTSPLTLWYGLARRSGSEFRSARCTTIATSHSTHS